MTESIVKGVWIKKNWIVVSLLIVGVCVRILGAIWFSGSYSMDHAVPCLMVKHIAEGTDFPAFYYGQPYMGSLEPWVGSLFYHLPISLNLASNLGSAVFGILLLPLILWWGNRAGGRVAGMVAVAYVLIGPAVYMQFMNWAYGGYAAITFLFTATLLSGLVLLNQERHRDKGASVWRWVLTGFCAGLGWWTSPMILPALMGVMLFLFVGLRLRCFQWKAFAAGGAFFVGSAPLWFWNAQHDWATFVYLRGDSGGGNCLQGCFRYVASMAPALLGSHSAWAYWLYGAAGTVMLAGTWWGWRTNKRGARNMYVAAAWVVLVISMLFFMKKPGRIGPYRYYLVLIPVVAVLLGHAVATLNRTRVRCAGWILLAVLLLIQARFLPVCYKWYLERHDYAQETEAIRPVFDALKTNVIFASYGGRRVGYGYNLYYNEDYYFVDLPRWERQHDYILKSEKTDQFAVMNNLASFSEFMRQVNSTSTVVYFGAGQRLDIEPVCRLRPAKRLTNGFHIIDAYSGDDWTHQLTDLNGRTAWGTKYCRQKRLQISFDAPQQVEWIRFVAENGCWMDSLLIEMQQVGSTNWVEVADEFFFTTWFWPAGGGRPYSEGTLYRQECFLGVEDVKALRLYADGASRCRDDEVGSYVELSEVQVFAASEPATAEQTIPMLAELSKWLFSHQIEQVYCDRWLANQLYKTVSPNVRISLEPSIYNHGEGAPMMMDLTKKNCDYCVLWKRAAMRVHA